MKRVFYLGLTVIFIFLMLGCPAPRPDKELELAKEKLEIAKNEEAPVFAKEDFTTAEKNYIDATNLVNQGKNEDAKTKALISITNSERAILNTRMRKAQESLSKLENLLKEAESLRMDVVYPESYNNYTNSYALSISLYNSSNYVESLNNSQKTISEVEITLKELKDKWNTARSELNRVISRTERLKKVAKWLSAEVQEIEATINEARNLLNEAKLDESIQKSREANTKIDEIVQKLKQKNEQELDNTGKKLKEYKINSISIKFLYFASSKEIVYNALKNTGIKIALVYEEAASPKQENIDVSKMSDQELKSYKNSLETELSSIKEEIKVLYSQAQEDYNNSNYEDSLEKLDRINQLLEVYSLKLNQFNIVEKEIEKRKAKFAKQPSKNIYSVKSGDFLSRIAGKLFRGQYWWWPKIFTLNKDKITDPDIIEVGTELIIPPIPEE